MFNTSTDRKNKYVEQGLTIERCFELADGWDDMQQPVLWQMTDVVVLDDSRARVPVNPQLDMQGGTKGRWGDLLISKIETEEIVYVQPRVGWAGIALAALARKHGKKLTLFMPASHAASPHQLVTIERGAHPMFVKIAAMPVLNKIAREYAEHRGATFIPFGMDHELVVAAGVKSTLKWTAHWENIGYALPDVVWTVVSTGVLTRTLQIAWPEKVFKGVAVARNMHDGECGRAWMTSDPRQFSRPSKFEAPFDSAVTYDLKGYEMMQKMHWPVPQLFWNVAGNVEPEWLKASDIDSQRAWGEIR